MSIELDPKELPEDQPEVMAILRDNRDAFACSIASPRPPNSERTLPTRIQILYLQNAGRVSEADRRDAPRWSDPA